MLMFGMVMTATGQVQQELEAANADLEARAGSAGSVRREWIR